MPVVETILEWGIFDSLGFELRGRSLALIHDLEPYIADDPSYAAAQARTILDESESCRELSFVGLNIDAVIESFIENVHTKNPIVEPGFLRESAHNCQLTGFKADGVSALVVSSILGRTGIGILTQF